MNAHIELVKKWLADKELASQEELKDNAADAYDAYYAADDAYAAVAYNGYYTADYVCKQLTTKQLATPLESGNKEAERVRGNFSAQVDLVNDQLKAQRELLNSRSSTIAPSISSTVVDVLLLSMLLLFIGLSMGGVS